jgi:hypothetical protein
MPATFKIDTTLRVVASLLEGTITDDDLISLQRGMRSHPDYSRHFHQILLVTRVSNLAVSAHGFQNIHDARVPGTQWAIVAESGAPFGMARMFQTLREGPQSIEVFREMSKACEWLSLDEQKIRSIFADMIASSEEGLRSEIAT